MGNSDHYTDESILDFLYEEEDGERRVSRRKVLILFIILFLIGIFFGSLYRGGSIQLDTHKDDSSDGIEIAQDEDSSTDYFTFTGSEQQADSEDDFDNDSQTQNNDGSSGSGSGGSGNNNNNNNNPTPTSTPPPTQPPANPPSPTPSPSPTPDPGYNIYGLRPELTAVGTYPDWDQNISIAGMTGNVETQLETTSDGMIVARFPVQFDGDKDWSLVDGGSEGIKSFFHYPGGISQVPGASAPSYSLFVQKSISTKVGVCPGATSVGSVSRSCPGIYYLDETDSNVSIVIEGGVEYWKVDGLTGTGAFSLIDTKDTLTRLEVNTASNHEIQFTTTYAVNSSGDTIAFDFVPNQSTTDGSLDFDFSSIAISDIDLEDDGVDKTLAASAAAGTWGVSINTTTDTITFTAPTDAGATEIAAGSAVVVKIGTNADAGSTQIINPDSVGLYELSVRLNNGSDVDFAELEVPIIDDDTTNVTGFIDTFISFDIDTSETDEDCDVSGGAAPCDSHGGSTDNVGYVVDLGEMNTSSVNDSGDTVIHSDGISGEINSVFFDLSTNADSGAAVTVVSLNSQLSGPGSNAIPDVADGSEVQITAGGGLYGINSFSGLVNTTTSGAAVINDDCDGDTGTDYYCDVGSGTAVEIFTTGSSPIDALRLEWEVGASPDAGDGTGTYTDQLTFIATATF
ncbi:MAG: hypothetical protein ACE5DX_03650 [Candidatus Dojkabacteria bacterium]